MNSDTSSQIQSKIYKHLSTLTPEERFSKMCSLCNYGRELMKASIAKKYPEYSLQEQRRELARRLHGEEFVNKYLGAP